MSVPTNMTFLVNNDINLSQITYDVRSVGNKEYCSRMRMYIYISLSEKSNSTDVENILIDSFLFDPDDYLPNRSFNYVFLDWLNRWLSKPYSKLDLSDEELNYLNSCNMWIPTGFRKDRINAIRSEGDNKIEQGMLYIYTGRGTMCTPTFDLNSHFKDLKIGMFYSWSLINMMTLENQIHSNN